jgi:cytochrome c553
MKKSLLFLISILGGLLFFSCGQKNAKSELDAETYTKYLKTGNDVSAQAQASLLAHVSSAMKQGGSFYAVEFCNLEASSITDSLSNQFNCTISRVSEKNRNPENKLKTETDKQLWAWANQLDDPMKDTLVVVESQATYYKPIRTALPACLQCHGPVETIQADTYEKLQTLYPNDLATGYQLNELRGLWKIAFEQKD